MRRGGLLRGGGTGEAIASRTVRRCTEYFSASARTDIWLRCQSNRIAAYSSTLDPIPTPATSSGRTSTDRPTIRPNPPTTEQPDGVSPTDITAGGANPECYARTDTGPRWGQNRGGGFW